MFLSLSLNLGWSRVFSLHSWLTEKVGNATSPPCQLPAVPWCDFLFMALTFQTCFRWLCHCYGKFRGKLEDAAWLPWQCQLLLPCTRRKRPWGWQDAIWASENNTHKAFPVSFNTSLLPDPQHCHLFCRGGWGPSYSLSAGTVNETHPSG